MTYILDILQQAIFVPDNVGVLSMNFLVPLLMIGLYSVIARGNPEIRQMGHRPRQVQASFEGES